jgi:hypothetical protein
MRRLRTTPTTSWGTFPVDRRSQVTSTARPLSSGYIETAVAHAPGGVEVELVDMLASEERVALIVRERLHDGDRVLDMRRANVYRVEDDRIVEISIFDANQYAVDEFLSGGPT